MCLELGVEVGLLRGAPVKFILRRLYFIKVFLLCGLLLEVRSHYTCLGLDEELTLSLMGLG